ncbi:hypothetical protein RFM98_31210, partial [Mesorhizobium sp. VK9D]|nr:hypothetical protein [Mesorhizobium sp. VK9D]
MSSNLFNNALDDIGRARDIVQFSCAVVRHSGMLRDQEEQAAFLQGAAVQFTRHFLPNWEQDIREGESFGYATVSNAVSRELGGQPGMQACRAMAAKVSRSTSALDDVDARALPLLALSFGRYPQLAECRDGTVRIGEFCSDNPAALRQLDARNLSLLVNGFSKWPDQPGCGDGTFAVAGEVLRRAETEGFSKFNPQ